MKSKKMKAEAIGSVIDEIAGSKGTKDREAFEIDVNARAIGAKIRQLREAQDLTQSDLGSLIGVNKTRISKIENGDMNVTITSLIRVFRAFNLEPKISFKSKAIA